MQIFDYNVCALTAMKEQRIALSFLSEEKDHKVSAKVGRSYKLIDSSLCSE